MPKECEAFGMQAQAQLEAATQSIGVLWPQGQDTPDRSFSWRWALGLALLALALRLLGLNQQLWYDEIVTLLDSVRIPFVTILTTYSDHNQHTFYSILARISTLLLGEQPWVLRLPAVLFGAASVPALYFCARLMTTQREALLAAAFLTVSYHHVWFSQNARGYTGLVFFTLLATYFFIRGARESSLRPWIAYALAIALGMYMHLTMAFVAAGHGLVYLWLLAVRIRQSGRPPGNFFLPLAGFALGAVITLLLYAPALPTLLHESYTQVVPQWINPQHLLMETLGGLSASAGLGAVVMGGVILLVGLVSLWRTDRYAVGLMVVPLLVTAVMVLSLWPIAHQQPRFFFFAIGFGLVFLTRGAMVWAATAARLWQRDARTEVRWGTALAGLMLLASAWSLRPAYLYPKQDFLGAMAFVDAERQPGDTVVTAGLAALPYQRYYGRNWPVVETPAQLDAVRAQGRRTWLLYTLPEFERWLHPEVWDVIQSDFTTVRVFHGTLGGGEIYVCRQEAFSPGGK